MTIAGKVMHINQKHISLKNILRILCWSVAKNSIWGFIFSALTIILWLVTCTDLVSVDSHILDTHQVISVISTSTWQT